MTGPPAEGMRVPWEAVPQAVRDGIARVCGGPVTQARTQPGGFSPGVAVRAVCAGGTRCFIKAVCADVNPDSPAMHRQEARVLEALDPLITARRLPIPRLWGAVDMPPWFALVLDDIDGRHPRLPWQPDDLARVLATVDLLAGALTPARIPVPAIAEQYAAAFTGWRTLAGQPGGDRLDSWSRRHLDQLAGLEASWAGYAAGDTLLHTDIRADNVLLAHDRVFVFDWPHACRGAAVVDSVLMAPSVAMQGGPPPAEMLTRTLAGRTADRQAVTAIVCALAGFFTERSLRPPEPGLPTVRAFQAAQGQVAREWLAGLLPWGAVG